jgi:hypothetical protein
VGALAFLIDRARLDNANYTAEGIPRKWAGRKEEKQPEPDLETRRFEITDMSESEEPIASNQDTDEPSNRWYEEISARTTTLPEITISLTGFAREEDAQNLGNIIRDFLVFYGKLMDLSGLTRVWVAYDYEGTLANLERGFEAQDKLAPTQDDIAVGIAMTPAIRQDGTAKSVMVLNAYHMIALAHPDNKELKPYYRRMMYTLAHECGHVHDLAVKIRSFPEKWLKHRLNRRDGVLFEVAEACWSEYIACRLSAVMSSDDTTNDYESTFCEQFEKGVPAMRRCLRQYRMHGDVPRVLSECSYIVKKVLVYASYLFGQLAGIDVSFKEGAPKATALLAIHAEVRKIVERLEAELEKMNTTYGSWNSFDVFEPLKKVALDLFAAAGLHLEDRGEAGMYVNIPYSADTLPNAEEQAAYLASVRTDPS